ncbi:MAG: peptidase [Lachnospiraceae bacterium]|jgi:penicillin-binding protein 2|nr:peptidase [Lachnospiraceae bacterium]MCI1726689.1 peptidase [Lachnospiraceae bacterium]
MGKKLKKWLKKAKIGRSTILAVLFVVLAFILIRRLYDLQIINGENYRNNFSMKTTKTLTLKSTRGNIYDRNGNILATNKLSYSLTITDSGSYSTNRQKALALNSEAYKIEQILLSHGDSLGNDFHIVLDANGNYSYNVTGTTLQRFKADVYGQAKIENLTDEQANASADTMMAYLVSEKRFAIQRTEKPYTDSELSSVGLPSDLTKQEILDITYIRYELFTTSYQKYVPITIATEISDDSVAELQEKKDELTGIDIVEDSNRVYTDPEAFASIIGYTGKVSADELATLQAQNSKYTSTSIVGKSGIEKVMETTLQGSDGQQTVYVDNLGRVLEVDESSVIQAQAGNDVYLTIDKDLQEAAYQILEQRIAGILKTVIVDQKEFDTSTVTDTANIRIPVYDVYNALIDNSVIDTTHFTAADASPNEVLLEQAYEQKQTEVFAWIKDQLTGDSPLPYNQLSDEQKEYESYIVNDLLTTDTGILNSSAIDKTDATYLAWTRDESISMKEYLTYAASQNWIDITSFSASDTYLGSDDIYAALSDYIGQYLSTDRAFGKILYKYLLFAERITPNELINVLYDQGVLNKNDDSFDDYQNQKISNFNLILSKIDDLEITPAMLALDPCSGSAVITDPNNGEILACVTYPGYDNNKLANSMDVSYYNKLANDKSKPFYNKATQQETAPGSTFKLITATAGLEEGAINASTIFNCTGVFNLTETPLSCWLKTGHGPLNVVGGIQNSCNVFFCNVAYQLGLTEDGVWSDSLSLSKLQNYAKMYNMDQPSGIEIPEADPQVSDQYAIQSAIGQGTHAYTTTQLARYVTTIASSGTSYNISLIDKTTDTNGNLIKDYSPTVLSKLNISNSTWDIIHTGMRAVIESKAEYSDLAINVAGKTGTAQESKTRPSHALFICYAPYEAPQISMAVRIGNGYSSTNAIMAAKDILMYYFNLTDPSSILTGKAMTQNVTTGQVD